MPSKTANKSAADVVWYDSNHRAWSANNAVKQAALAYQTRTDQPNTIISSIGLVLAVICTIISTAVSGDLHQLLPNAFTFILLFAGLIMLAGNVVSALSSN